MSTPNNGWGSGGGWGAPQPGSGPSPQPAAPGGGWGSAPSGGAWGSPSPQQAQPSQPQQPSWGQDTSQSLGRDSSFGNSFGGGSSAEPEYGDQSDEFTTTSAPHLMLVPSLALAVISLVMLAIAGFGPLRSIDAQWGVLSGVAWALSGIVGVSALGLYFSKNTQARAEGLYEIVGWKQALFYVTVAALVIAVVLSSIMFALWFGRQ
ncbi:hypothetical protein [Corynebacterium sp. HMSC30G07]|uniref:hypothetical protein n=1 Tax=Corynebacterium sp. HMSC30G07 TaxID=1581072 RepID=UPI000A5FF1AE|nr:hypothetical protein [Corynebacterium sp. HMSC30G07]